VFSTPSGRHIDLHAWRSQVWKDAVAAAGLAPRGPKHLRHTGATLALAKGIPVQWVAAMLGHADVATTLTYYGEFVQEAEDSLLKMLDAA
jgi:integrase